MLKYIGEELRALLLEFNMRRIIVSQRALKVVLSTILIFSMTAPAMAESGQHTRRGSSNTGVVVSGGAAGLALGLIIGGALSQANSNNNRGSSGSGGRVYRNCSSTFGPGAVNSSSNPGKCVCRSGYVWTSQGGQRCVARGGDDSGSTRSASRPEPSPSTRFASEEIETIQEALNLLGHDAGDVDGALGYRTQRAISKYQEAKGFPRTGTLTPSEFIVLKADVDTKKQNQQVAAPLPSKAADPGPLPSRTSPIPLPAPEVQIARAEVAHWESVRETRMPAELEDYLSRYPNGQFSRLAQLRLDQLKATAPQPGDRDRSLRKTNQTQESKDKGKSVEPPPIDEADYPRAKQRRRDAVAVIIGNRIYENGIPPVDFAHRDAEAMRVMAARTLGIDPDNIIFVKDATRGRLDKIFGTERNNRGELWKLIDPDGASDVIVYYSGHGVPGVAGVADTNFILPVDGDPNHSTLNGYPLSQLYKNLADQKTKSVTVFIDACFSGVSPDPTGVALIKQASPIFVSPAAPSDSSKINVFAAATERQLSSWDAEAGHGIFTRFLLTGLSGDADDDRNKEVTAKELNDYVKRQVRRTARRMFGREQEPQFTGNWNEVLSSY